MTYGTVVLATDLGEGAEVPWVHALRLAAAGGGSVKAVHAARDDTQHPWSRMPAVASLCERWGVEEVAVDHVGLTGDPTQVICEVLGSDAPELVVLGTHRPSGLKRLLQGSVAEQLVRCREHGVSLVVPDGARGLVSPQTADVNLHRVVIPVGSDDDQQLAIDAAVRFVSLLATDPVEFVLLHRPGSDRASELVLPESSRWSWRREEVPATSVVAAILEGAVRFEASLIVMVSHGHDSVEDAVFGSMTERVLRDAFVPLLVVRP